MWKGHVLPPPLMYSISVSEGMKHLFDLMCFSDNLCAFSPHIGSKQKELSLEKKKLKSKFLGIPLVCTFFL